MFMIVSKDEFPVYELQLDALIRKREYSHLHELIMNASLDTTDLAMWSTPNMYLKTVDKYNELSINAFVTPSSSRFLLLHEGRPED
mmetsp:Transcript_30197/g.21945  ORF Transcript_30197/g.21945 Transcript_30197/m.21945 type:complete len:86 (-) Transcript_30197:180-437(-)